MDIKQLILKIRNGEIDVNNQQNIFSALIKGLIVKLNEDITVRGIPVPHMILHTGDDTLYLENKNKDYSATANEVTNENYIYSIIPRCIISPGGVDFIADQLTSPHVLGELQMEYEDSVYNLTGEFKRLPFKFACELKYYLDSYSDSLELIQQIATKLSFVRTFNIIYLGKVIKCSYKIPEAYSGEYMTEVDGMTSDNRSKTISLSLEIESNMPVFSNQTIMDPSCYINPTRVYNNPSFDDPNYDNPDNDYEYGDARSAYAGALHIHNTDEINKNKEHEIIEWDFATGNSD